MGGIRRLFPLPSPSYKPAILIASNRVAGPCQQLLSLHRTMSSSAGARKEFLCIIPDKPGSQAKRLEVRPTHLANLKPTVESGLLTCGGAMLEEHPAEGQTPTFKGSVIFMLGNSVEEIRQLLKNDIYAQSGVWDLKNTQIIPFKTAVRVPL